MSISSEYGYDEKRIEKCYNTVAILVLGQYY